MVKNPSTAQVTMGEENREEEREGELLYANLVTSYQLV
jgi:hypothetical protein